MMRSIQYTVYCCSTLLVLVKRKEKEKKKKKLLAFTRQLKFTLNTISKQTFIHTLTLEDFQGKVPPEPNQYY